LKGQHSFLTPYREEKLNQAGFSWHVRNSLDSEVQTVMDELINNNRNALAATSTSTTDTTNDNMNVDGATAATNDAAVYPVENGMNPVKEEQHDAETSPSNEAIVNDSDATRAEV
jgi:hypothetical protein